MNAAFCSFFFFFFVFTRFWRSAATIQWTVAANVDFFSAQCIRALFTNPQISFFINFFIKNGSHGTIYTFKNYFTTVISAINFQFQQNKSYPNRPLIKKKKKRAEGPRPLLGPSLCESYHWRWLGVRILLTLLSFHIMNILPRKKPMGKSFYTHLL